MKLKELREKCGETAKTIQKMADVLEKESRDFTAEERSTWDTLNADYDSLSERVDQIAKATKITSRMNAPADESTEPANRGDLLPNADRAEKRKADPDKLQPWTFDLGKKFGEVRIAPDHTSYQRTTPEYREAYSRYLRTGETRGIMAGDDSKGGYLTATVMSALLIKFLDDDVTMRQLGTVLPPLGNATSLGVVSYDTDPGDATWTAEVPAADISEDTAMRFGKRELEPHLNVQLIKMSQKILRSSTLGVESLVRDRLGYRFALTEEKAFLTGDGAQQPLGVFTASSNGISTSRDITAASQTTITADELIDVLFSLRGQYISRATWLMHRDTLKIIRKLKDGNGQYLWQPGLQTGGADRILDRPLVMNENAPNTFSTGLYTLCVADFSFYWIVDSIGLEIQVLNELFQLRNQIGILGRKETDGMPVLEEAFARLILA